MVAWSVFKEGKSCSRFHAVQKVAENAISCSKVAEHNLFTPDLRLVAPPPPRLLPTGPVHYSTLALGYVNLIQQN